MKSRYILLVIVIAAILAIAAFITISLWLRSPEEDVVLPTATAALPVVGEAPPGMPMEVDGVVVYLDVDPANAVRLKADTEAPRQPVATTEPVQPTATSAPQVVVPTQLPTNTPVPAVNPVGPAAGVEPIIFIQYVVTGDDTLYRITEKQATSIELMSVHGIDAADLSPGVTLTLPVANPNYCTGSRPYVVRPGDTAFSIATRFNTTNERIAQLNNLGADYRIDIAEVICVP